jgi:hypothetical protein
VCRRIVVDAAGVLERWCVEGDAFPRVGFGVGVGGAVLDAVADDDSAVAETDGDALERDGPPELQAAIVRAANGSTKSGGRRTFPRSHAAVDQRWSAAPVRVLAQARTG